MQLGIFFSKISRSPEARNRIAWSLHFSHLSRTRPSAHFRVHPPTQTVPACLTVWQSVWLSCGLCRNNFIKWESRNKWNGNWVENAPWQEVGSGEKRATAPAAPAAATTIEVTTATTKATTTAVAAALNTQTKIKWRARSKLHENENLFFRMPRKTPTNENQRKKPNVESGATVADNSNNSSKSNNNTIYNNNG